MFTAGGLLIGAVAAFLAGISKTGLPGAALVSIPLIALVIDGRQIPGATLPILIVADLFAIAWYRSHTRWDVLRPLTIWLGVGFAIGIAFFASIGGAGRTLERAIGVMVLVIVIVQLWRMFAEEEPRAGVVATAAYGATGGFTTFVANAAGPVINTYLATLRLPKSEFLGTSAWLYFAVNLSKIPFYIALGLWSAGGSFFTLETLVWDAALVPAVVAGAFTGRILYERIPQRSFLIAILVLSGAGALALVI